MENLEKIKEKIRKLLALSESAEKVGSLEEAANAMEKAQTLLLKYNLDIAAIPEEKLKDDTIRKDVLYGDLGFDRKHGTYISVLLQGVCKLNFCQPINHTLSGHDVPWRVSIIGSTSDVEISLFMFEQLQTKIKYLEAREWKLYDGHDKRGKFRRGFYMGAAMALRNRLTEMYYKIKEGQYEGVDGQACTALVLMKEDKTESKVNSEFPRLILGKVRKSNGSDGVGIGYARGKAMEINKGVSNHSHKQLN